MRMTKNVRNLPLQAWNAQASCPTNCDSADKADSTFPFIKIKSLMGILIFL